LRRQFREPCRHRNDDAAICGSSSTRLAQRCCTIHGASRFVQGVAPYPPNALVRVQAAPHACRSTWRPLAWAGQPWMPTIGRG
jgi:hypothetical protein